MTFNDNIITFCYTLCSKSQSSRFDVNIRQIRAFHATILSGSVSKAATSLSLTQPAVSKLLKNLEETVEYQLFERTRGRINPTPEARYLFQEVDSILSQIGRLDDLFQSASELSQDRVKIGSIAGPSNFFIPYVLGKYLETNDNIRTSIITRGSPAISDAVACQSLDIGIIDATGISPRYEVNPLPISYFCAMPCDDPLAEKEYITPHDLDGKPLISLPKGQIFYELMAAIFLKENATFNVVHEIFVHMPAISMVSQGLGYAFVDTLNRWSYAEYLDREEVIFKPFKPVIKENLTIITPTIRPLSGAILELAALLKSEICEIEEKYTKK